MSKPSLTEELHRTSNMAIIDKSDKGETIYYRSEPFQVCKEDTLLLSIVRK